MASRSKQNKLNVMDLDLYGILGVLQDSTDDVIKKAYRKKALKCHPDKNPDNPSAAAEWEKLAKALEVLADLDARAAYDRILKAKKAAELRNQALESKRRKIKQDLESRESAFQKEQEKTALFSFDLEKEIKRLREEGSQTLKQEQELLKQDLLRTEPEENAETPKLKVKWKSQKGDPLNGGYSHTILKHMFDKYGEVKALILSGKRSGSAIVEFASPHAAELAVANEFGLSRNPLQLSWLTEKPAKSQELHADPVSSMVTPTADDFESAVLQRLMQAQERKDQDKLEQEQNQRDQGSQEQGKIDQQDLDQEPDESGIKRKLMEVQEENKKEQNIAGPTAASNASSFYSVSNGADGNGQYECNPSGEWNKPIGSEKR